ncbi:MAG: PEP-CTERM sorting domain-containing protein [Syntrophobacteraceae bacterium]
MRKTLVFLAALGMVFSLGGAAQAITIYNDYVSFVGAFPSPKVENFEDTVLNQGLSFVSQHGATISDGVFKDVVGGSSDWKTTWSNSNGFTSFGGWFDLVHPGGPGQSITMEVWDGTNWVYVDTIPNTASGEFWGFSTGYTFYDVRLSKGNTSGVQETYWSVDLAYRQVPEPATLLLLGVGLLGAGCYRKFRG